MFGSKIGNLVKRKKLMKLYIPLWRLTILESLLKSLKLPLKHLWKKSALKQH